MIWRKRWPVKKNFERKESIRYVVFSGRKLSKKWSVHNAFLEKSLAKDLNDISCQFLATRTFETNLVGGHWPTPLVFFFNLCVRRGSSQNFSGTTRFRRCSNEPRQNINLKYPARAKPYQNNISSFTFLLFNSFMNFWFCSLLVNYMKLI